MMRSDTGGSTSMLRIAICAALSPVLSFLGVVLAITAAVSCDFMKANDQRARIGLYELEDMASPQKRICVSYHEHQQDISMADLSWAHHVARICGAIAPLSSVVLAVGIMRAIVHVVESIRTEKERARRREPQPAREPFPSVPFVHFVILSLFFVTILATSGMLMFFADDNCRARYGDSEEDETALFYGPCRMALGSAEIIVAIPVFALSLACYCYALLRPASYERLENYVEVHFVQPIRTAPRRNNNNSNNDEQGVSDSNPLDLAQQQEEQEYVKMLLSLLPSMKYDNPTKDSNPKTEEKFINDDDDDEEKCGDEATGEAASAVQSPSPSTSFCSICLQEFEYGEDLCNSNNKHCVHLYHRSCMASWIGQTRKDECPTCRQQYVIRLDDDADGDKEQL